MGIFRLFLAVLVVIAHLSGGFGEGAGPVAVFSFYVLSGYLITRVVNTTYSNGLSGITAFAINRGLRLYPTYWFVAIISLLIIIWLPGLAASLNPVLTLPTSRIDAMAQITIVGLHKIFYLNPSRLVPTAWSLNIELVYYALIAIALGRQRYIAALWWAASLTLCTWLAWQDGFHAVYFSLWGPSICFSTGSMLYHYGPDPPAFTHRGWLRIVPFAISGMIAFAPELGLGKAHFLAMILAALPATVLAILVLLPAWKAMIIQRVDTWAGDLSYPVFLSHWPLSVVVSNLLPGKPGPDPLLLAITLPVVILFSFLVTTLVEAPIRALRARVRRHAVLDYAWQNSAT